MPATIHFVDDKETRIEINYDSECAAPGWYWRTEPFGVGAGPFPTREEAEADMREHLEVSGEAS